MGLGCSKTTRGKYYKYKEMANGEGGLDLKGFSLGLSGVLPFLFPPVLLVFFLRSPMTPLDSFLPPLMACNLWNLAS